MRKFIAIVLAAMILGVVLFFYISFNGNFISKAVAKKSVEKFAEGQFEGANLAYRGYNFKDKTYIFDVKYREWSYTVEVGRGWKPEEIYYVMLHADSNDQKRSDEWATIGRSYLQKLLGRDVQVSYFIDVPNGFEQAEWKKDMNLPVAPSIVVEFEVADETAEQFLEKARDIQAKLDADGVHYRETRVMSFKQYDNRDGAKEGYAPIYTEGKYQVVMTPGKVPTLVDVR